MSTRSTPQNAVRSVVPFVVAMLLWIVLTAVIYGGFVLVWPDVPEAEPWIHLGVYLVPMIGYAGHTLHLALGARRGTDASAP